MNLIIIIIIVVVIIVVVIIIVIVVVIIFIVIIVVNSIHGKLIMKSSIMNVVDIMSHFIWKLVMLMMRRSSGRWYSIMSHFIWELVMFEHISSTLLSEIMILLFLMSTRYQRSSHCSSLSINEICWTCVTGCSLLGLMLVIYSSMLRLIEMLFFMFLVFFFMCLLINLMF